LVFIEELDIEMMQANKYQIGPPKLIVLVMHDSR